jgi:phospholipase C
MSGRLWSPIAGGNVEVFAINAPVTLFAEANYAGASAELVEGATHFAGAADFNDSTWSVRVATGYCAVLYENANEFGGYGATVELLEDCADLAVLGFEKKTSFVRVFRAQSDVFVWARAALVGGQFVAGHWERTRGGHTGPVGVGATPVVSPPIPAPTTAQPGGSAGPVVRDHPPAEQPSAADGVIRDHRLSKIKHVFVLMLENRSFDHMLGFSGITGTDISTGQPTTIIGLKGTESNSYEGHTYPVVRGAADMMQSGPGHNFKNVLEQLCGEGIEYRGGAAYPPINNSGFVSDFAKRSGQEPNGAMKCFAPEQVPVLTALAKEFLVCDRWFSSMPGPTEPNRWFVHAATAGDYDDSPKPRSIVASILNHWGGFSFKNGTIFNLLEKKNIEYRIYACDHFPNVAELDGISRTFDVKEFDEDFERDVASPSYNAGYTFIEPSYDVILGDYADGNSQHPVGSVRVGEMLIKRTYEAIRKSPHWENSMLIVTYDEHGGFYDHLAPPAARPTGEKGQFNKFTFDRLGARVPAIVISPLIPRNMIDHRRYEHSSIPATLIDLFGLSGLTVRERNSSGLKHLASLSTPRTNTPMTLPNPAGGALARLVKVPLSEAQAARADAPVADDPEGSVATTIRSAMGQHLRIAGAGQAQAIAVRIEALKTRGEALAYVKEVAGLIDAQRAHALAGTGRPPL